MSEIIIETLSLDVLEGELKQVFDYWLSLKDNSLGPSWQELDLLKLPLKRIPFTLVTDILDKDLGSMRYRFVGTDFTRVHGFDLTGKSPLDVKPASLGEKVSRELLDIVREKNPTYSMHHVSGVRGLSYLQRVIRLPLSDDGKEVTHILSVVDYIEDKQELEDFLSERHNARN